MGVPQFSRFAGGLVALDCSEGVRARAFSLLELAHESCTPSHAFNVAAWLKP
jgi:hypothetical protein